MVQQVSTSAPAPPRRASTDTGTGKVLAVASHVVSGFVGNAVTSFVLQLLGLETASLNTVQFSNHSGYRQKTGETTSAEMIASLWKGLKMNGLEGFEMVLSGYCAGAKELEAVGEVVKDAKRERDGRCFWLLDPVMGDQGRLYVSESVVPVYRSLLPYADLIVPNQFEAELLSGIEINTLESLALAIDTLHQQYRIPHVVVTSVTLPSTTTPAPMFCAGSSRTYSNASRKFFVEVPVIDGFFSGTGDLFAGIMLARLRELSSAAGLSEKPSWLPGDDIVEPEGLPLAKAVQSVLASMNGVLLKTKAARDEVLEQWESEGRFEGKEPMEVHVMRTRASELRLVQCREELMKPQPVKDGAYVIRKFE